MPSSPTFGRRAAPPAFARSAAPPIASPVAFEGRAVPHAERTFDEAGQPDKTPYLTIGLATLLALIFIFEQTGGLPMGPGMDLHHFSLVAAGGMSRELVFERGEWWRIFTAPLLHASLSHIVGNVLVMLFAAITLERLMGRAWLAATFVVSAIGGSIGSLLMNPSATVTVGASGAIMGLLAMVLASSLHFASHDNAKRLRWIAFRLMIPSLIPFAGSNTDYNGHLGGAVAGGLMGFALLVAWPEEEDRPRLRRLAAILGWTGLTAAAAAFVLVSTRHGAYIARGQAFAPAFMLPKEGWGTHEQARRLVARYPHDPRARLYAARSYFAAGNAFAAESEARLGLAETEALAHDTPQAVGQALRYFLVVSLVQQHRETDAVREAAPLCAVKPADDQLKETRALLAKNGLCPA